MITPYDIVMTTFVLVSITGAIWANHQVSKAAKEGKLRVMGVHLERYAGRWEQKPDTEQDTERIDWIAANRDKMPDVYWRMGVTTETTFRNAVDIIMTDPEARRRWNDDPEARRRWSER